MKQCHMYLSAASVRFDLPIGCTGILGIDAGHAASPGAGQPRKQVHRIKES